MERANPRLARMAAVARPRVTLLVPVKDEEDGIIPFLDAIDAVFARAAMEVDHEVLFVNDGSTDATELVIRKAVAERSGVGLVSLSRNFGKDAALAAGLAHARGDAVIPMDVDLQDCPEILPEMIAKWRAGAQVVLARRENRDEDDWLKRATAGAFYKIFNRLAESAIPENVGDYRLLDRQVVDILNGMGERIRFYKAMFSWVGFKTDEVTFKRRPRRTGQTKWSLWKLWNFALDGIFSSSTVPLRVWSYLGALIALAAFAYAAFVLVSTLITGVDVPGYASTIILILFFGGVNLLSVGVLGEYVGRIYAEVRGRPVYIVASTVGLDAEG